MQRNRVGQRRRKQGTAFSGVRPERLKPRGKSTVKTQSLQGANRRLKRQMDEPKEQQGMSSGQPVLFYKPVSVSRKPAKPAERAKSAKPTKPAERARSHQPVPSAPLRNKRYRLSVIVPAMNEAQSIGEVLREVQRLGPNEVIVVVNGSGDATSQIARSFGAKVIEFAHPLGNDVGRAVGALHTDADIYLFIDGDFAVKADVLLKLIREVQTGTDVALNSLHWLARYERPDIPSMDRYFLNMLAGRNDLGLENLLTIPHALSRQAVNAIGSSTLANPLLATVIAIDKGLKIACPTALDVLAKNKFRPNHRRQRGEKMSSAFQRMHGDTVEAVRYWMDMHPPRESALLSAWTLEGLEHEDESPPGKSSLSADSVVLWMPKWVEQHQTVIQDLQQEDVQIVLVTPKQVWNASGLASSPIIQNVELVQLNSLGYQQLAFAAGALKATGHSVVFHDLSVPIHAAQLLEFTEMLHEGKADVVVTNQIPHPVALKQMSPAALGNWFVNVTEGQDHLRASGMLLPPFALRSSVLHVLTPKALLNLVLAQAKAAMSAFSIQSGPSLNTLAGYDESQRKRNFALPQILNQFSETLDYWTAHMGRRGGFTDEGRDRSVLPAIPPRYYTD
ncbi:glycosyltransferase family 2 protein [Alicyclobacillus sp. SO9]|uniref:glycosyltransferase family 2 protein n=1 Tax=Alicyclobacillus sp. SO9 TaxID=2665646 RepID=UPI0018E7DF31|nr:glycosyltransferase family 2 protein [Alicyclobacillus sp. SO9]QQE80311.1 glycosyltransferase family 2 protein [Alicyclobacillus sp. SO9]